MKIPARAWRSLAFERVLEQIVGPLLVQIVGPVGLKIPARAWRSLAFERVLEQIIGPVLEPIVGPVGLKIPARVLGPKFAPLLQNLRWVVL